MDVQEIRSLKLKLKKKLLLLRFFLFSTMLLKKMCYCVTQGGDYIAPPGPGGNHVDLDPIQHALRITRGA
jgi:hypothetical protein